MYACEDVEVRTCLFEGVDQMVGHVEANASVSIYPSARKECQSAQSRTKCQGDLCKTWAISDHSMVTQKTH